MIPIAPPWGALDSSIVNPARWAGLRNCGPSALAAGFTHFRSKHPMSLLKNCDGSDCERGERDGEARRPSISAVICKGGATKSARPPRRNMNCCGFSTGSYCPQHQISATYSQIMAKIASHWRTKHRVKRVITNPILISRPAPTARHPSAQPNGLGSCPRMPCGL